MNLFIFVLDNVVKSFNFFSNHFHFVLIFINSLIEFSQFSSHSFIVLSQLLHLLSFSWILLGLTWEFRNFWFILEDFFCHFIDVLDTSFKAVSFSSEVLNVILKLLNNLLFLIGFEDLGFSNHLQSFSLLTQQS